LPPPFVVWDSSQPFASASFWISYPNTGYPSTGAPSSTGAAYDGVYAWLSPYGSTATGGTGNSGLIARVDASADADGDGTPDNQDVGDSDGDLLSDFVEHYCGSLANEGARRPERIDGAFAATDDDGNTLIDEALPGGASAFDCDGDGYKGSGEDHVYLYLPQTNGDQKMCQEYDLSHPNPNADIKPSLRWPSDFNKATSPLNSFNRITINDLTTFLAPVRYFGTDAGDNPGGVRWDLSPGPSLFTTDINIVDLTALIAGSTGNPPMLGGAGAFGGPVCPWAP
jgi:hypothetical protein